MLKTSIKMSIKELFMWGIVEVIAAISTTIIIDIANKEFRWLFLLPLSYCVLNVLFIRIFSNKALDSFVIVLIHGFYFIRIVLAPLLFALSGCHIRFGNETNATSAILLMIYEMMAVYIAVLVCSVNISKTVLKELTITDRIYNRCKMTLLVIVLVLMGLLVLNPNSILLYRSGLDFFDYSFTGFTSTDIIRQYSDSFIRKSLHLGMFLIYLELLPLVSLQR